jgi:predicted peptidase
MRILGLVCLVLVFSWGGWVSQRGMAATGNSANGEQSEQMLEKQITKKVSLRYLLYLPKGYGEKKEQKWPLMLFLHGAGERGNDLNLVKKHGPPKLVDQGKEFPFIIVSPQCPSESWWTEQLDALTALLDDVQAKYAVDPDRVYLTGLSMGGFGTWALACRYPERFAAIAPICGGGEWFLAPRLKNVPVWAFHGAKDPVVPLRESTEMVESLKKAGGDVQLTVYPEAQHDSWTETYNNPKLYDWFLSHRRNEQKK